MICLWMAPLSEPDKERLLMGEDGMTAFIVAEMQHFVNATMVGFDKRTEYGIKWEISLQDKIHAGLESDAETKKYSSSILQEEYRTAKEEMMMDDGG
jgi:hypothetical protein